MWLFQSFSPYLSISLLVASISVFFLSILKVRDSHFFSDTPGLLPFGMYVWGDALVIGFFWIILTSAAVLKVSAFWILLTAIIFLSIRSLIEIFYWLHQQFQPKPFNPPLLRRYCSPLQSAIVLQLWHTVIVCFGVLGIIVLLLYRAEALSTGI